MTRRLMAAANDQRGQALVEYALILFFIAIVCVGVLTTLGTGVRDVLQSIADRALDRRTGRLGRPATKVSEDDVRSGDGVRDERGVAMTEFALILPVLMLAAGRHARLRQGLQLLDRPDAPRKRGRALGGGEQESRRASR